jgi:hypothetical protein
VCLEGLGKQKKYNDLIGNRTRDLPACRILITNFEDIERCWSWRVHGIPSRYLFSGTEKNREK